jgi:hypothetical protein
MDCHVADAPRNDGHFRNDESNSRHCEAEGRGNPRSPGAWIATSLTLLAMTVNGCQFPRKSGVENLTVVLTR